MIEALATVTSNIKRDWGKKELTSHARATNEDLSLEVQTVNEVCRKSGRMSTSRTFPSMLTTGGIVVLWIPQCAGC